MNIDRVYADLISNVRDNGYKVNPRNGERVRLFAPPPVRFASTPLVSVRKAAWKNAMREWAWFMSGSNNIRDLHPAVRKWWEPWAHKADGVDGGEVFFNYSEQFRHQDMIDPNTGYPDQFDQITALIDGIKSKPYSARHVIGTWYSPVMYHPACKITNCHSSIIQCVVNDGVLDLFTYQRSCDLVCGLPHNWVQSWAFLVWLAHRTGNKVGELIWQGGDVHLYGSHLDMADKIIRKVDQMTELSGDDALPPTPQLVYTPTSDEFKSEDFTLDRPYTPLITEAVEMVV